MPKILLVTLGAVIPFFIISRLNMGFQGSMLCWLVILGAAFYYPRLVPQKLEHVANRLGYCVGMGALIGAFVNFLGVSLDIAWDRIAYEIALRNVAASSNSGDIWNQAGKALEHQIGQAGSTAQLYGAPIWGAILGLLGGLIGGSTIPKFVTTAPAETGYIPTQTGTVAASGASVIGDTPMKPVQ